MLNFTRSLEDWQLPERSLEQSDRSGFLFAH